MLFNSIQYLAFFVLVTTAFFLTPQRFRWVLLLVASYYFYMCWKPEYAILLGGSTLVDYTMARLIDRSNNPRARRAFLVLSLTFSISLLGTFKYLNFVSASLREALAPFNIASHIPAFNLLLPVAISFFTFQTIGYVIDVYRGTRRAEHHLGIYAVYVSFFPQLVAGPIERSTNLLPQFREVQGPDPARFSEGLKYILWGLFKKMAVADRLAAFVQPVYASPDAYGGPAVLLATYAFAIQIYCDFSGYSDIAVGSARVLGFRLMRNFDRPYASRSIVEFWRRWHISLSTWFRDYLYFPLGGSRVSAARHNLNLMAVFVVSGLWHGANWTFVLWGAFHGAGMVFGLWTAAARERLRQLTGLARMPRLNAVVQTVVVFHFVALGWVLFRAQSLTDAWALLSHLFAPAAWSPAAAWQSVLQLVSSGGGAFVAIGTLVAVATLEVVQMATHHSDFPAFLTGRRRWMRWGFYHAVILFILFFGVLGSQEFIYFQF